MLLLAQVRDPRVDHADNETFLSLMEDYFNQPTEVCRSSTLRLLCRLLKGMSALAELSKTLSPSSPSSRAGLPMQAKMADVRPELAYQVGLTVRQTLPQGAGARSAWELAPAAAVPPPSLS